MEQEQTWRPIRIDWERGWEEGPLGLDLYYENGRFAASVLLNKDTTDTGLCGLSVVAPVMGAPVQATVAKDKAKFIALTSLRGLGVDVFNGTDIERRKFHNGELLDLQDLGEIVKIPPKKVAGK